MKKVIWGTGLYAGEFAHTMKKEEIAFFIDNDRKKCGKYFMNKKILYPDEIEDWNELNIYIPFNFYDEIVEQLKGFGINDELHFYKYYDSSNISNEEFRENYENALAMLRKQAKRMKNSCIFWGRAWSFDNKGYKEYLQALGKMNRGLRLGLVSEAVWYSQEQTENIMRLPSVVTPDIFDENIFVEGMILEETYMEFLSSQKYTNYGVEYLKAKFPNLADEDAYCMVYYLYQYVIQVIDILCPRLIITYHLLSVYHRVLEEVCMKKGVALISTHPGILPGTLSFDIGGEIGSSLPAVYPRKFLKLPVDKTDIEYAQKIWDYLYMSKLNRKIQHRNNGVDYVMREINKDKPIVFFVGQNDIDSNMVPYTEVSKRYHSPIFESSIKAGIYLAELCEKNGWNFVYKPHPMSIRYDSKSQLPTNTIYVESGNINDLIDISDVVVTILSTTNYISLIRHKPVVMLGYTQTKGKGCTYEAFEKDLIEDTIKEALDEGFTKEQEGAFLKHIAQIVKYYLYDDGMEREIRYGREVPGSIEDFYELEKLLKEDAGD